MTRIALLAESGDPRRGGAERAIRATAEALHRFGVETELHVPADRAGPELAGATLKPLPIKPLPRATRARFVTYGLAAAAREQPGTLIACGKLLNADLIWSHGGVHACARDMQSRAGRSGWRGAIASGLRQLRPVEWTFGGIEREQAAACNAGQSRYLALSERVAKDARDVLGVTPAGVVPNGVDRERFSPPSASQRRDARAALCARAGFPDAASVALFAATSPRLKGFDAALAAVDATPGLHLAVVGSSPSVPVALRERVHALGFVTDMQSVYRGAGFLLHPTRYDPCSLVVLEALACGLGVVTTQADGAAQFVTDERGIVLDSADDLEGLSAACQRLTDPEQAAAAQTAASGFCRGWDQVARELLEFVETT